MQINNDTANSAAATNLNAADTSQTFPSDQAITNQSSSAETIPHSDSTPSIQLTELEAGADASQPPAQKSEPEYSDFSFPEGLSINQPLLNEFKDTAKALGLNQQQAQQLADLGVKQVQTLAQAQQAALEVQKTTWLEAVKADKELGGDKMAENLAVALRAVNAFVSPELKALLDSTGLGNHPDMVRAFYKAGKLISEDSLLPGGTKPAGAGRSVAQALYPDQA